MLFHIIYVSTAVAPMTDDGLAELLHESRVRNARNRITGLLLYKSGHFMQALEGQEENVTKIFWSIKRDHRHRKIDVLRADYMQYRDFPDWTMGFRHVDAIDPVSMPGFSPFLEQDFTLDYFCAHTVEAHRLLLAFKESNR